jgi:hypothetical protein
MTSKTTLLTRQGAARYLGLDPNTISSGRVPGFPRDAVALSVGRNQLYDAAPIIAFGKTYRSTNPPTEQLRAEILRLAPKVKHGTTVVSNVEIASIHPALRKADGKVDSASVSKWANRGWMPEPIARFDTAEHEQAGLAETKFPPLYDLDAYLEHNLVDDGQGGKKEKRPVDQAAVAALRESHTIGHAAAAATR